MPFCHMPICQMSQFAIVDSPNDERARSRRNDDEDNNNNGGDNDGLGSAAGLG